MTTETAISIKNCTRRFGPLTAVNALNLAVAKGEIFGLVGPDGAGKTTTLRMLCGLLDPDEGEILIGGHSVQRNLLEVKDRIGYMAQRFGTYLDLTVEENLFFYADLFGIPDHQRDPLMVRLLHMTRMEPFRQRQAAQLSGGMKQKLALMCCLLHRPEILILDEPTNGVDPVSRRDFWAILYQLVKEGLTVVVTTAYLDEAERCSRVGLMFEGRLVRCESPDQLKQEGKEECYEVQTPSPRSARTLLQSAKGVVSVESAGPVLHLFLDPELASAAKLSEMLEQQGLGSTLFKRTAPSLEDVFIAEARKASHH
ncbi:MAG: ABC transporter ATP-binding protein [Acidobacteria bacterium]|nr:ABC transporter ATP-binding protein [Acidobacteriota bacterium]